MAFGDLATCDHVLMTDGFKQLGVGLCKDMLNYYDFGTDYVWSDPVRSQDLADTVRSFKYTSGPNIRQCVDTHQNVNKI